MICSAFNEKTGLYDYFETSVSFPFNADLPVPQLPASAGKVGVAAIDAARTLPPDARYTGSGWSARGMVVQLPGRAMSGLGALPEMTFGNSLKAASVTVGTFWLAGLLLPKGKLLGRALLAATAGGATLFLGGPKTDAA